MDMFITVRTKPRFWELLTVLGVKPKLGWYVFWLFFKKGICSIKSLKRYRRELSIDVASYSSMLKITKIHTNPVLVSYPKHVLHTPNSGFVFTVIFKRPHR